MVANISFNPILTTTGAGAFVATADGDVAGTMFDDPAVRHAIRGGLVATTETVAMYGGIGIAEQVPTPNSATLPSDTLGPILVRATTLTATSNYGLSGFTLFNQSHNMINTPQGPVPLSGSGMMINYVRLGTGARIAVAADPNLVTLEGGLVGANVSWDFSAQRLQAFNASATTIGITSITWSTTNGGQGVVVAASTTTVQAVGDAITFSGATNSGTGGNAAVNSTFICTAYTSGTSFVIGMTAASGVFGTIGGAAIVSTIGSGALACRVDRLTIGASMVPMYNPVTGFWTWNYAGSTAVITI